MCDNSFRVYALVGKKKALRRFFSWVVVVVVVVVVGEVEEEKEWPCLNLCNLVVFEEPVYLPFY